MRTFVELVERYVDPELCPYPEYKGKPYYSIKYIENGEEYVGYSSYSLQVMSGFLKKYFMSPALEKQEQDRWIPCKERLPELESEVLVTDEYGEIRHADYSDWFGKAEFRTVEESMTLEDVKAWRPLPEPYTEEES